MAVNNQKINLQYTTIMTPLPDFIYDGLREYSQNAYGYRPQPEALVEKLSQKYNISREMLYLTAGADEAIQILALAFGSKTYIFLPTYIVYHDTKDFFANVTEINVLKDNNYSISTERIDDATLIYLANPNNPCGYTTKETVCKLLKNNPQAIVVVDEVYAEFADVSVIDEVKNYPNLVVLRSFSKSYGMAGNRIGFIVANREIIAKVKTKTQWANVSYLSVGAAMIALDHEDYFTKVRNDIISRREDFITFLTQKGFRVLPSLINAVLIKCDSEDEGSKLAQYLVDNNFVISHGNGSSNVGLDYSFIRISIGNREQMAVLTTILEEYHT